MNKPVFSTSSRLLAIAGLLSLPFAAQAVSNVPASAEASLTELSYHLVDLTPDDAQTPWLKVNKLDFGFGSTSPNGQDAGSISGKPLPQRRLIAISDPMTSAQVAPDALVTQALATGPYRLPATTTLTPGTTHVLDERSAIVSAYDSPDMEGPRGLILAPHSTLVFQGTALISTYANADIGVFGSNDSRLSQPYTHEVSSTAQIHIGFRSEPGFGQDLGTPWHAESSSVDVLTSPGGGALSTESPVSRREFKPFEFTLTNDSDQALPAYFNWYLTSTTKASVTTAVPEPGTWALLVAGLALAPVMRRGKKTLR